jgi:hypothetical protein
LEGEGLEVVESGNWDIEVDKKMEHKVREQEDKEQVDRGEEHKVVGDKE